MTDLDVIIAGAGPAGVATAVALLEGAPALSGRVLCLERARLPRDKPCGGALTGRAQAALAELGLELRVPAVRCSRGIIAYGDRRAEVSLPGAVAVVQRIELDADLVMQARGRGVVIQEGEAVSGFRVDARTRIVEVRTSAGRRLTTRVLVGADGAGSAVRRALLGEGGRPPLRLLHGHVPAPAGWDHGELVYDFSVLDGGVRGYAWIFPSPDGRLAVGLMHTPTRHMPAAGARRVLAHALARRGLPAPGRLQVWPAWPWDGDRIPCSPSVLCVGDAAGIDALTGEGLGPSLQQALLAGRCLATSSRGGMLGYADVLRSSACGRELRLAGTMARLLYAADGPRLWLPLVLEDQRVQRLVGGAVSGTLQLHQNRLALLTGLARYLPKLGRAALT